MSVRIDRLGRRVQTTLDCIAFGPRQQSGRRRVGPLSLVPSAAASVRHRPGRALARKRRGHPRRRPCPRGRGWTVEPRRMTGPPRTRSRTHSNARGSPASGTVSPASPARSGSRCGAGRRAGAGRIARARQPGAKRAERERRQRNEDQQGQRAGEGVADGKGGEIRCAAAGKVAQQLRVKRPPLRGHGAGAAGDRARWPTS